MNPVPDAAEAHAVAEFLLGDRVGLVARRDADPVLRDEAVARDSRDDAGDVRLVGKGVGDRGLNEDSSILLGPVGGISRPVVLLLKLLAAPLDVVELGGLGLLLLTDGVEDLARGLEALAGGAGVHDRHAEAAGLDDGGRRGGGHRGSGLGLRSLLLGRHGVGRHLLGGLFVELLAEEREGLLVGGHQGLPDGLTVSPPPLRHDYHIRVSESACQLRPESRSWLQ